MSRINEMTMALKNGVELLGKRMDALERSDAIGYGSDVLIEGKAHANDGGHAIQGFISTWGRGDWRWTIKGSLYSSGSNSGGDAQSRTEAIRRLKAEFKSMMRDGANSAQSIAERALPESPQYEKFHAIAKFYRKQS